MLERKLYKCRPFVISVSQIHLTLYRFNKKYPFNHILTKPTYQLSKTLKLLYAMSNYIPSLSQIPSMILSLPRFTTYVYRCTYDKCSCCRAVPLTIVCKANEVDHKSLWALTLIIQRMGFQDQNGREGILEAKKKVSTPLVDTSLTACCLKQK